METSKNKAILVVSFGTSHRDTCTKTIEAVEQEIQENFPGYVVYRAWTSGMIRRKLLKRDGVRIFSVSEALEQIKADGIRLVVVQPTHILNGVDKQQMLQEVKEKSADFEQISVGDPLLSTQQDCYKVADILVKVWKSEKIEEDEMLIFMGHGICCEKAKDEQNICEEEADRKQQENPVYEEINQRFREKGYPGILVGAMEGEPGIGKMLEAARKEKVRKVVLMPFMVVAGKHAVSDLAGEREDSWKSVFEREGYEVRCVLKGLGEYEEIRRMFLEHADDAAKSLIS